MKIQSVLGSVALGTLLLFNGCASKPVYQEQTGFLNDYETLLFASSLDSKIVRSYSQQDLKKFEKIAVASVRVIPAIPPEEQTDAQKELYRRMTDYLTEGLKKELSEAEGLELVQNPSSQTLDIEVAVSAVEVHLNDAKWNQFSKTALGLNVVSYGVYMDEAVRILIEMRLSKEKKLQAQSMQIMKDNVIRIEENVLEFNAVKPALDAWLKEVNTELESIRASSAE